MADKDLYDYKQEEASDAGSQPAQTAAGGGGSEASLAETLGERSAFAHKRRRGWNLSIGTPRIGDAVMISFLRQLVMKLDAGVPLLRAMTTLAERTPDRAFRDIVLDVGRRVEGGSTLWQAFGAHPKHFDNLFVNLIKAGETSGTLTGVITRMSEHMQKRALLRRQVRSAMIYPVVILGLTVVVLLLFMLLVLPSLEGVFASLDVQLPAFTRAALWFSHSLMSPWLLVYLSVIGGAVAGFLVVRATPAGKFALARLKMRVPVFGDIITKAVVADFTRTFGTLLGAGISILETLDLTRDAGTNIAFARDVQHMRDSIERGEGLERPLRESTLMPAIVTDMLVTGEESGALERISHQVATVYEAEVDAAVAALKNLIEPVVILFLGVVVGGLCLSFFLPYASLMSQMLESDL